MPSSLGHEHGEATGIESIGTCQILGVHKDHGPKKCHGLSYVKSKSWIMSYLRGKPKNIDQETSLSDRSDRKIWQDHTRSKIPIQSRDAELCQCSPWKSIHAWYRKLSLLHHLFPPAMGNAWPDFFVRSTSWWFVKTPSKFTYPQKCYRFFFPIIVFAGLGVQYILESTARRLAF